MNKGSREMPRRPDKPSAKPAPDVARPDLERIDEAVLALLYLGLHDGWRAWKSFDWGALDRLHARGLISNPASKNKSVEFSDEGKSEAEAKFRRLFCRSEEGG
jgi:hypothetical protein